MTPVPCLSKPGEFGDCWRACIASILDLCTSDVPHFFGIANAETADGRACNRRAYELGREWLQEQGLGIFRFWVSGHSSLDKLLQDYGMPSSDVPVILHGEPLRPGPGDEAHAVVAMGGKVVHDPSGIGLSGPCRCDCGDAECKGWWWIDVISVGENWQCGTLAG